MENGYSQITSLISKIHSLTSDFLKSLLEKENLPEFVSSHGNILFQLSKADKLTMTELAQKINRDKSTTTVLVRKLCKAGFVEREQSTTDNRVVYISLTSTGREYNKSTAMISKELTKTCYNGFSEKEKEAVYELLNRIADNFSNAL